MSGRVKKLIYWGIYLLLLLGGIGCKTKNLLPIQTTVIFLFGLFWIWTGVSLACGLNPYYARKYERKFQRVFSLTAIGLGLTWSLLSLTPLSARALPMILISIPFLIPDLVISLRHRNA